MSIDLIRFLETRISANLFDPDRSVSDDRIAELVGLATRAPSAFNLQNWRFIAVRSAEAKARLHPLAWKQQKVLDAAVTFIVCGQLASHTVIAERLAPSVETGLLTSDIVEGWTAAARGLYEDDERLRRDEAIRSASLGAAMLMVAASALGLAAGPMIGFDAEAVARAFDIPSDEVPAMLVSVGHPAEGNWPQKPRRPLAEVLSLR